MNSFALDGDADAAAGRRQRAAHRLPYDQFEAVIAGEPELERGAEIDGLLHRAIEGVDALAEPLGTHQHPDARADGCAVGDQKTPPGLERDRADFRHGAVEDVA